jgi:hypothetical protein
MKLFDFFSTIGLADYPNMMGKKFYLCRVSKIMRLWGGKKGIYLKDNETVSHRY